MHDDGSAIAFDLLEQGRQRADKELAAQPELHAAILMILARVYERELKDSENALVAWTHAVIEAPADAEIAAEVERLAGDDAKLWGEVLSSVSEAAKGREATESVGLYLRAGRWYQEKTLRPEYALACYNQVIAKVPGNDAAPRADGRSVGNALRRSRS